jgi:hypothetical protein
MEAEFARPDDLNIAWQQPVGGSFDLDDSEAYQAWREDKLAHYPRQPGDLLVPVGDLAAPTPDEISKIRELCRRANMAIYQVKGENIAANNLSDSIRSFAAHFGLSRLDSHLLTDDDGVTALTVADQGTRTAYIPYSTRPIGWHTDGYYNDGQHSVRGLMLHCAQPAATGGENAVLDQEIAYIHLRDENPAFITALMHPHCMTLPANPGDTRGANGAMRPARTGPVFSLDPQSGRLHMRFTARQKNIEWRSDPATSEAVDFLLALLEDCNGPALHHRMSAGQGLISNNVLHNRTAFGDDAGAPRLMYRARFFDRIEGTGLNS